jgi:hypothetical protein
LWIFRKFHYKINISLQSDNNSQCFTADRFIFVVSSGWIFLKMRKFLDTFSEDIKTHFSFQSLFPKCSGFILHCSSLKTQFHSTVLDYVIVLKVKQSYYISGQALRVPGGWGSKIERYSTHEGGKFVIPKHLPLLPNCKYSWYLFC